MKICKEYEIDIEKAFEDKNKNKYQELEEKQNNIIIQTKVYFVEEGKTTLKGDYPKLNEKGCKFPNRLSCNYGPGFERCKFMEYKGSGWTCTA